MDQRKLVIQTIPGEVIKHGKSATKTDIRGEGPPKLVAMGSGWGGLPAWGLVVNRFKADGVCTRNCIYYISLLFVL